MSNILDRVSAAASDARLSDARRSAVIAEAVLDGHRQADVARAAGISQSAVSQMLSHRTTTTMGSRWSIPVLAAHLARRSLSLNELIRACAQFSTDFRSLSDPIEKEIAVSAPPATKSEHLDALVAGLADYETHRAGQDTPSWTISLRYRMFPSWFAAPTDSMKAYVMQNTPPQFAVRGVFLDWRDLESV